MFLALKHRTLIKPFTILFLIISQLCFCPQIYCEIYKWVDKEGNLYISQSPPPNKEGHTYIGDSPQPESNKKSQGDTLSSGPQSVTGEFFKKIIEDYGSLPINQVNNKYSGQIIKSTGLIQNLEYLRDKKVSEIVILVHSEAIDSPGFKRYLERLESEESFSDSMKLSKGPDIKKRGPGDIIEDKYFVVVEYPGSEIVLNYKKGDVFNFQGSYKDIPGKGDRPNPDPTPSGKNFRINFKPFL